MTDQSLQDDFNLDLPVIMAPMFLVSDVNMVKAAMQNKIIGSFPSMNYRGEDELAEALLELNKEKQGLETTGTYAVNLIVQRSNPFYKKHLDVCIKHKVPMYITSLGNPKEVIMRAHEYGAKVYCDVTNLEHARKVVELGADGLIAVGQGAGGHAGPNPLALLIPSLKDAFPGIPVIAAGGIADGRSLHAALLFGADGASVGTRFIACSESPVSDAYKKAVVNSKMDDIVMSERISGTPSTVINTAYAKKIGYRQNAFERLMNKNRTLRKYFKMLTQLRGMKKLEKSVKPGSYKNLWIAGKSVELIDEVLSVEAIVSKLKDELTVERRKLRERICK
jgi:nitronate monooxygenase